MKHRSLALPIVFVVLGFFLLGLGELAAKADRNPSASGDIVRAATVGTAHVTFSCVVHKDGAVTGSVYVENLSNGRIFYIVVDEVLFSADGTTAYVGGQCVIDSFGIFTEFRTAVAFSDMGKGQPETDRTSYQYFSDDPGFSVLDPAIAPFLVGITAELPVLSGNIQVRSPGA